MSYLVRSDNGYVIGRSDEHSDDEGMAVVFGDDASDAMVFENEVVAAIAAAFVGGEVVEMAQA